MKTITVPLNRLKYLTNEKVQGKHSNNKFIYYDRRYHFNYFPAFLIGQSNHQLVLDYDLFLRLQFSSLNIEVGLSVIDAASF